MNIGSLLNWSEKQSEYERWKVLVTHGLMQKVNPQREKVFAPRVMPGQRGGSCHGKQMSL